MKLHKLINRQQKKNKKYKKKAKRPFRLKIHKVKKKQLLMMNYEVVLFIIIKSGIKILTLINVCNVNKTNSRSVIIF